MALSIASVAMMRRSLWFLAVALALPGGAHAADWKVDPAASKLGFTGSQSGSDFQGQFQKFDVQITFDPTKPEAAHVKATIDTGSARTGDPQKDSALPQSDWFDVMEFPQAVFEASGFRSTGANAYEAAGKLTIRGMTHDLTLPFTLTIDGDTAHAKGHVQLIRSAFGVGQGTWNLPQYVAFEVGVDLDLVAHKAAGP